MRDGVLALLKKQHEHTVFAALGIEVLKVDGDETILSLSIEDRHRQHLGLVHGGIFVLLAESAASIAAACFFEQSGQEIVALEINANHIRAAHEGILTARARPVHRGRKTLIYEIRIDDDKQRLISIARCTLMVVIAGSSKLIRGE